MKLSEIVNSQGALGNLLTVKLPVKIAYKISKIVNKSQPELKIYEDQRIALIKQLGEQTDKEKDIWTVKPDNINKFSEELNKLQDIEVNFSRDKDLEKIKISELGEVNLEPKDLVALNWLFED